VKTSPRGPCCCGWPSLLIQTRLATFIVRVGSVGPRCAGVLNVCRPVDELGLKTRAVRPRPRPRRRGRSRKHRAGDEGLGTPPTSSPGVSRTCLRRATASSTQRLFIVASAHQLAGPSAARASRLGSTPARRVDVVRCLDAESALRALRRFRSAKGRGRSFQLASPRGVLVVAKGLSREFDAQASGPNRRARGCAPLQFGAVRGRGECGSSGPATCSPAWDVPGQ